MAGAIGGRDITQQFLGNRAVLNGFAIENQCILPKLDRITRFAHDALDETLAIMRRIEDHDVSAPGIVPFGNVPGCKRHFEIISQLVDVNAVAFNDGWLHRARRDVVPIRKRRTDGEQYQRQDQERTDFFDPPMASA